MPTEVAWLGCSAAFSSVRLFDFPHGIPKTDAARITKPEMDMVHTEFWKPYILGSKGQISRSRSTKSIAGAGYGAVVSAGFF